LGTHILDASLFSDTSVPQAAQLEETIEHADGFAQVFPEHKFISSTFCKSTVEHD
jgi:H+-transporting ATPase